MAKIVRCFNCKTFQMTNANKIFKCIKCQKSRAINKQKIYFENSNLQKVTQILQEIKKEKAKIENNNKEINLNFKDANNI